jgi:RNA polymerase sigma-70 factor (ECF subfamily)
MTRALRILATVGEALAERMTDERGPSSADEAPSRSRPRGRAVVRPDADLARRCVSGDEEAQRVFVERYTGLVFSLCRRKGLTPDAAEDVTQEVLAEAFQGLAHYRAEARLSTWLFTLACRHVAHYFRSPARRQVASGHPGDLEFPEPAALADRGLEARVVEQDRAMRARRAVEALGEPLRTILLGYYLAEMSVTEIAHELDLPEGTVKSHLHRGRSAVREKLEAS